jgi:hypothetical protein
MIARARAASSWGRQLALASAVLAAVSLATAASATGPTLRVVPAGPLPAGTQALTVSGSGFDPVGNRGNGVYVVFGPIVPAPAYYLDPSIYAAFKWIHPTAPESGAESPMAEDGSFSTTLVVPSSFTGPQGSVDCSAVPCAVITFGAHGSQDRSQDTCTALTFEPATASGEPAPAASIATVAPSSDPAPAGSALPVDPVASFGPADPCDAIGGATGS